MAKIGNAFKGIGLMTILFTCTLADGNPISYTLGVGLVGIVFTLAGLALAPEEN